MRSSRHFLTMMLLLLAACARSSSSVADAGHVQCKTDCFPADACVHGGCTQNRSGKDAAASIRDASVHPGRPDAATDGGGSASRDAAQVADDAGIVPTTGAVDCRQQPVTFPSFDRTCNADSECMAVRRTTNCCGSELVTAVNQSVAKAFQAAAASCNAQFPACGCAAQPPRADDGTAFDDAHPYAVSKCTAHVCGTSFVAAARTACGPSGLTCDARTEVCVAREPVGPAIVYECKPVPAECTWLRSCACMASGLCTGAYNTCSDLGENQIDCQCPMCQ